MQLGEVVESLDTYRDRRAQRTHQMREGDSFPTGSLGLDLALGGGWRKGWFAELSGDFSTYKTSLALHTVARVQEAGGLALWLDSASDFNPVAAQNAGVNLGNLALGHPKDAWGALEIIRETAPFMHLIVVDSAHGLDVPEDVNWNACLGFVRRDLYKTTVLFLSSVKTIRNIFVDEVRKAAGQRVRLSPFAVNQVAAEVRKNDLMPPHAFDIRLLFLLDATIDPIWELVVLAHQVGVIEQRGSWYYLGGLKLGQGIDGTVRAVRHGSCKCDLGYQHDMFYHFLRDQVVAACA